ncbi:hypothetical protein FHW67_004057 [Herbaspirillum sp. Sphag1AN]|uniref:hypothetical protein n=1 Tax=unclassified Herbaspirillum TaxID=2624150 RepID=UPI00161F6574|nr:MULTISPECIES: hypothetical protein [unclassified Herbaspirillum]MBB3214735.1 hypothetical protein [Herbaspirillum sp. Sphag1AN]MBB3247931.1 hypothetical protein [Herbaspirillum sp. Sphag64]
MQTIERDIQVKSSTKPLSPFVMAVKEGRCGKVIQPGRSKGREDDCSAYDKLPKQMDDIVEGESPKRFKRPKMASDIVAR